MSEFLFHDPTNRQLWDQNLRFMLGGWWIYGIIFLMFGWMLFRQITNDLPHAFQAKAAHDTFIAASEVTEASLVDCTEYLLGSAIAFEFIPVGSTSPIRGHGWVSGGDCAKSPVGGRIQIRYLPSNPSQHERVKLWSHEDRMVAMTIAFTPLMLLNVLLFGHNCLFGLLLSAKGRVRIGRIVSAKRMSILLGQCWVRYTVTADDGMLRKGWRVLTPLNTIPALEAGSPIPVLYANEWVHQAFGLTLPRESKPVESMP